MNINENIWGAESTWRNALTTPVTVEDDSDTTNQELKALELAKVKISTENFTVADALTAEALDKTEDFDNSVSFWNIGAGANYHYLTAFTYYEDLNGDLQDISQYFHITSNNLTDSVPVYVTCRQVEVTDNFPTLTEWDGNEDNNVKQVRSFEEVLNSDSGLVANEYTPNLFDNWCERPKYNISDSIETVNYSSNNYEKLAPVMDFDYSRVIAVPSLGFDGNYTLDLDDLYNDLRNRTGFSDYHRDWKGINSLSVRLVCTKANNVDYLIANNKALGIHMIQKTVFSHAQAMPVDEWTEDLKIWQFNDPDIDGTENPLGIQYGQEIINSNTTYVGEHNILIGGAWVFEPQWEEGYYVQDSGDTLTGIVENARSLRLSRYPVPLLNDEDCRQNISPDVGFGYASNEDTNSPWKHEVFTDENGYKHLRVYLDLHWFDPDNELSDSDLCLEIRSWVFKQVAYLGFQFTTEQYSGAFRVTPQSVLPNGWYVPKFENINGVLTTNGEYTHNPEEDPDSYPNGTWGDNLRSSTTPTPPTPVDPDEDSGDLTTNITPSTVTSSTKYFKLSANDILTLVGTLNGNYNVQAGNTLEQQLLTDFKGTNPYEYINSVVWFPFNVTASNVYADIIMGAYNSGMNKPIIELNNNNTVLNFGTVHIKRTFNDFRDYAPYTKLQLDIPFCGKVELDTKVFMNHDLSLYIFYDITSGKCTALIYRDNLLYQTLDGVCGVNIPLTAVNMAQYQNAIAQLENGMKQTQLAKDTANTSNYLNTLGAFANLGANLFNITEDKYNTKTKSWENVGNESALHGAMHSGVLSNINTMVSDKYRYEYQQEMLDYSLTHTAPTATVIGSSDPLNNLVCDFRARLLYVRCTLLEGYSESIYKKTVGYATVKNTTLGSCHGFTIATNLRTDGITATTKEKELLNQALLNGVILD